MELDINWNQVQWKTTKLVTHRSQSLCVLTTRNVFNRCLCYVTALLLVVLLIAIYVWYVWSACSHGCNSLICQYKSDCAYYYPKTKVIKYAIENKFLLSNDIFCHIHSPYMLILVPSRTESEDARNAIRETYSLLSRDKIPEVNGVKVGAIIRTLFILGTSNNETLERKLLNEHLKYADILQVDVVDSYYNLTGKLLHAFKWVDIFCNHVTYILKADDDVFVNISILLEQLKMTALSERGNIFGRIYNTENHAQVFRDGKWGVTYEEYPLNKYPPYAQGTSYTMTRNLVPKIVQSAQYYPYLRNEDVFITGIISGKIHGAVFTILNKTSDWGDPIPNPCKFVRNTRLSQHNMTPFLMRQTWKALMSFTLTCNTYRGRRMTH